MGSSSVQERPGRQQQHLRVKYHRSSLATYLVRNKAPLACGTLHVQASTVQQYTQHPASQPPTCSCACSVARSWVSLLVAVPAVSFKRWYSASCAWLSCSSSDPAASPSAAACSSREDSRDNSSSSDKESSSSSSSSRQCVSCVDLPHVYGRRGGVVRRGECVWGRLGG
jgi:hypothetical protein